MKTSRSRPRERFSRNRNPRRTRRSSAVSGRFENSKTKAAGIDTGTRESQLEGGGVASARTEIAARTLLLSLAKPVFKYLPDVWRVYHFVNLKFTTRFAPLFPPLSPFRRLRSSLSLFLSLSFTLSHALRPFPFTFSFSECSESGSFSRSLLSRNRPRVLFFAPILPLSLFISALSLETTRCPFDQNPRRPSTGFFHSKEKKERKEERSALLSMVFRSMIVGE